MNKPMAQTAVEQNGNFAKPVLCDVFKGKLATLKEDFLTDDASSCDILIKKDSKVYIKGNKSSLKI